MTIFIKFIGNDSFILKQIVRHYLFLKYRKAVFDFYIEFLGPIVKNLIPQR